MGEYKSDSLCHVCFSIICSDCIQLSAISRSIESTEADRKSSRGEACVAADNNNNSGVDVNQQYREWKEMMVAATAARDRSEREKQVRNWLNMLVNRRSHL